MATIAKKKSKVEKLIKGVKLSKLIDPSFENIIIFNPSEKKRYIIENTEAYVSVNVKTQEIILRDKHELLLSPKRYLAEDLGSFFNKIGIKIPISCLKGVSYNQNITPIYSF